MIGSSPSVLDTLPNVLKSLPDPVVITCNSGIKLYKRPEYYLAVDQFASHLYHDLALDAQNHGTTLVTLDRGEKARRDRKIEHFDTHLTLGEGACTRDQYGSFRYSGPLCVEFACHHGARSVHLVGFDGYTKPNDYFDPETPRRKQNNPTSTNTQDHLIPRLTELAAVWHDVWFIQYGTPCFEIIAPNWIVSSGVTS